jgi:gluconate kinase
MHILGIAGLSSSGKDTVGDYLAQRYGWMKVALSDVVRRAEGSPRMTDSTIRGYADGIRAEEGHDFLARVVIDAAEKEAEKARNEGITPYEGIILTSVRLPAEARHIIKRSKGHERPPFIWIEGEYEFLYERRKNRDDGRPLQSIDKFIAEQKRQLTGEGTFINLSQVRAMIPEDQHILNFYEHKKDLIAHGERVFQKIFPHYTPSQ